MAKQPASKKTPQRRAATKKPARGRSKRSRPDAEVRRLTGCFLEDEGWWIAQVLEVDGVFAQERTIEKCRESLYEALVDILDEAPHQLREQPRESPWPGSLLEPLFLVKCSAGSRARLR